MASDTGQAGTQVITETCYGKVRGARVDGVTIFRGIPYGGATEGPRRFLPASGQGHGRGCATARPRAPGACKGRRCYSSTR